MTRLISVAAAVIALVAAAPAWAGGFNFPGNGTKSAARGGAYMLSVTGPEALQFNPALLSRLDGHQVTVNTNLHLLSATFDRAGTAPYSEKPSFDGDPIEYGAIENEALLFPAPSLYLSSDFGLEDLVFAIGAYGPNAVGARKYPVDGPQRFLLIESEVLEIYYSAAVGYNFNGLRIGGTFQLSQLLAKFTTVTSSSLGTPDENPNDDAITALEVTDFKPTGLIGVAYDVDRSLSFGALYQFPVDWVAEGTVDTMFDPNGLAGKSPADGGVGARLTDDSATFKVSEPDVFTLAARYAHLDGERELFDVELEATYERWSVLENYEIIAPGPVEIQLGQPTPLDLATTFIPHNWQDTWSVRLGGDVNLDEMLTVRAGGFYETAASKSAYTNIDFFAQERFGLGLGASIYAGDFDIDVGYMAVFFADREVGDGELRVLSPLVADNSNSPVANNGTYEAFNNVFSVGFTYRYGATRNAYTPRVTQ